MRKAYRVKSEKDFRNVFQNGKNTANRQFVVYNIVKQQEHFRVGISVGKKIGNAVTRNAIKRKIRQSIHELRDYLRNDRDFIIIARKPAATMTFFEVKKSLIHVLKLADMFHTEPPKVEIAQKQLEDISEN